MSLCPECGYSLVEGVCMACGWEPTKEKHEREYYSKAFREVLNDIYNLARGGKTSDYGETWKRTGLVGIYIKLMIKEGRLRELVWKGKQPQVKGESVRDTLMDIAAYAVYGILCLDEDNYDGEQSRQEHLQAMLLNIKEELNNGKTENQGSI